MAGFVALDRSAFDHPLLRDGDRFRAWFWLIARACWQPTPFDIQGRTIILERGQLCASRNQLASEWEWSPSRVERFLARLQTERMIGQETGQGRTVITICNYSKYQDISRETGQATGQATGPRADQRRSTKEPRNHGTKTTRTGAKAPSPRARGAPMVEGVEVSISDQDWEDFRDHRAALNARMSPRAELEIVRKLGRLRARGYDPTKVLEQTIRKGLRDVSELDPE